MAEQEVVKHTKAVYKIWKDPSKGWKHKLQDILLEIGIIVFAITLSLWLHNWSEHNHERAAEKDFLVGLKNDLEKDLKEMQGDKAAYSKVGRGMQYFYNVAYGQPASPDSMKLYKYVPYNTTQLAPNISRFEGLKASGKIDIIEDKELQKQILELYQEDIPFLIWLNESYNNFKTNRFQLLLDKSLVLNEDGSGNWEEVFHQPEMQNTLRKAKEINEIMVQYDKVINKNQSIIKRIDIALD